MSDEKAIPTITLPDPSTSFKPSNTLKPSNRTSTQHHPKSTPFNLFTFKPSRPRPSSRPTFPSHTKPRIHFQPPSFSTFWDNFKKHIVPPTHPSTTSSSELDSSLHTELFDPNISNEQLDYLHPQAGTVSKHKRGKKGISGQGAKLLRGPSNHSHSKNRHFRKEKEKARSKSSNGNMSNLEDDDEEDEDDAHVSEIVVEGDLDRFIPKAARSDSGSTNKSPDPSSQPGERKRDVGGSDDEEVEDGSESEYKSGSKGRSKGSGSKGKSGRMWEWFLERVVRNTLHFFDSRYPDEDKEYTYQKEAWFASKSSALVSSCFFIVSWILTISLSRPIVQEKVISQFVLGGCFTLPLPLLVMWDFPRHHPFIWQPMLFGAAWIFADTLIVEMKLCDFFAPVNTCTQNFLNTMGFAFAQPTLAMLSLRQNRLWHAFGACQWLCLTGGLLMTRPNPPKLFYRNMALSSEVDRTRILIAVLLFHVFLIVTSFLRERADRQIFALRQQLKFQFRATQKAQVLERKAADSKKRFVSYIFHEVRVPLNTALLAVQNLEGEGVFKRVDNEQAEMVHGLMGSLSMMEKVLNDVLSFNRMESGKFSQARKQFEFNKSIQLVALSHRVQAQAQGIDLILDLDPYIDKVGGIFVGDEMRLRQIASNLVSNSIKFTPSGSVRIVTKLLYPRLDPTPGVEADDPLVLAAQNLQRQQEMERDSRLARLSLGKYKVNRRTSSVNGWGEDEEKGSVQLEDMRSSKDGRRDEEDKRLGKAVIRVEVHDTGVGLKRSDMADHRLFSPYVQTEIGKRQGGKGSGLGLALVKQIVKVSKGRLGVESQIGKGSMFWFEIPYAIPSSRPGSTTPGHLMPNHTGGTSHSHSFSHSGQYTPHGSPVIRRAHTLQTVPLDQVIESVLYEPRQRKISEQSHGRPTIGMTESSIPLLAEARKGRRVWVTTDEPTDILNISDTSSHSTSHTVPLPLPVDYFSRPPPPQERRSSEVSEKPIVERPTTGRSVSHRETSDNPTQSQGGVFDSPVSSTQENQNSPLRSGIVENSLSHGGLMIQNNQIHNDHLSLGAPIPPTDTIGTGTVGVADVGEKEPPLRAFVVDDDK
ncbi:hypothetical protein TREMEDRAFT_73601 [Tremella mesenterica DSM 1558]|uniref:uncharacterized protein n=1 Tax=Tremella mesenterica (strain ATCC 24925 / CBS 8224 / DSM 1558 / NBRC 9311 / NRRL Y-6157 / RJB 2259-6 / UBC 559-6) TaxID=578456 RepID=UPI0003F490D3|nr:uncharacterized protein TREMEDRAFT_73601 [Tremella mesenterica DSM 1558]EIW70916.1 hypothetical protein TREMEDRAFT_73601 [Tremella mesenterica DSM 1558]